jgi:hypothetical protein
LVNGDLVATGDGLACRWWIDIVIPESAILGGSRIIRKIWLRVSFEDPRLSGWGKCNLGENEWRYCKPWELAASSKMHVGLKEWTQHSTKLATKVDATCLRWLWDLNVYEKRMMF